MIIDEKHVNIFYEAAFQNAINEGSKIYPVDVGNYKCMEIDTVEDLKLVASLVTGMN